MSKGTSAGFAGGGGIPTAETSQLNQIQTPQASSQRAFVPNKNQILAFRQSTGGGGIN